MIFTLLHNNGTFWLSRSAHMLILLIFWSDFYAQMGWVLYCYHIYIVIVMCLYMSL